VHNPDFTLQSITAGRQDAYLRSWATDAKAWGAPFLLRFGWEMNGDWFPWAPKFDDSPPSTFVAAWRHAHDVFRSVGATNARWVWCPATDPHHVEQPLAPLYPGDDYVDWTCLDGYNRDEPWETAEQILGPSYDEITQEIAPRKPMLLGEIGSTESGGSKPDWIAGFFAALPARFPQIRAFAWFDQTVKAGTKQHDDWPFDSTPASAKAFARGIASARYKAGGG
jgi:beta-mannanase